MFRRWTALLVAVLLVSTASSGLASGAEIFSDGPLILRYLGDQSAEVIGLTAAGSGSETIRIPASVQNDTLNIIGIGSEALADQNVVRTVILPDSVTYIGTDAFNHCDNLRSINIPDSVTSIGERAFYMCGQLQAVDLPAGIREIAPGTFYACNPLKSVTVPDEVRVIGSNAFASCYNLETVNLPAGLEIIGSRAFEACARLRNINMPASVSEIGAAAFAYCWRLTDMQIPEGITEIAADTFSGCGGLTSFAVPESVVAIGDGAFESCTKLAEFEIFGAIVTVGSRAFAWCSELTEIEWPEGLVSIGDEAFSDVAVRAALPKSIVSIGDGAFNQKGTIIDYAGSPSMWTSVLVGAGNDGISEIFYASEDADAALSLIEGSNLDLRGLTDSSATVLRGLTAGVNAPLAALLYEQIMSPDGEIEVLSANGTRLEASDGVGTGAVVQAGDGNGSFLARAYVIVSGDLTGSGILNIAQLVGVAQALTGTRTLTPLQLAAVDFNNSGKIDISDLAQEAGMLIDAH